VAVGDDEECGAVVYSLARMFVRLQNIPVETIDMLIIYL
jgi:hypothetical protein